MAKILVIEDDVQLRSALEDYLKSENHAVDTAADGEQGAYCLSMNQYDLAVVDWEMPKKSGVEVCRQVRATGSAMPILMLTGKRAVPDRIEGLDSGADDYLTKPFDMGELSARVRALLRRPAAAPTSKFSVGYVTYEVDKARVLKDGVEVHLLPKELALLEFFMRHPGQVFSPEAILNRVWPSDSEASPSVVKVYVNRLRAKLDTADGASLFKTIHGIGYKMEN